MRPSRTAAARSGESPPPTAPCRPAASPRPRLVVVPGATVRFRGEKGPSPRLQPFLQLGPAAVVLGNRFVALQRPRLRVARWCARGHERYFVKSFDALPAIISARYEFTEFQGSVFELQHRRALDARPSASHNQRRRCKSSRPCTPPDDAVPHHRPMRSRPESTQFSQRPSSGAVGGICGVRGTRRAAPRCSQIRLAFNDLAGEGVTSNQAESGRSRCCCSSAASSRRLDADVVSRASPRYSCA